MNTIKKIGSRSLAALVAASALSSAAFAGAGPPPSGTPQTSTCAVPEIDPGAAAGALTLLVGGVMSLADRRRSK